jgi:hypothetical protein
LTTSLNEEFLKVIIPPMPILNPRLTAFSASGIPPVKACRTPLRVLPLNSSKTENTSLNDSLECITTGNFLSRAKLICLRNALSCCSMKVLSQ